MTSLDPHRDMEGTCIRRFILEVKKHPHALAATYLGGSAKAARSTEVSYIDILRGAVKLAQEFSDCMSPPKKKQWHIACFVDVGIDLVVAWLGALLAGAVIVPMDATYPADRLKFMCTDCDIDMVLTSKVDLAAIAAKLDIGTPEDDELIASDGTWLLAAVEDLLAAPISGSEESPENLPPLVAADIDDVIAAAHQHNHAVPEAFGHVVYTSGTTGQPKGILATHAAMHAYTLNKIWTHNIDTNSRVLLVSALTWDPALGDVLSTLCSGATLCLVSRPIIIHDLARAIRETAATHVLATPALWSLLHTQSATDIPTLRCVALGGEPMPQRVISTWSNQVRLINTYGVTEGTVYQTWKVMEQDTTPNNVGVPFPGVHVRIAHDTRELWLGGIQITSGYLNRPAVTRERFVADDSRVLRETHARRMQCSADVEPFVPNLRWFRTGDIVQQADNGLSVPR
eukprot:m.1421675 g.1421675  ORF g.1421675 m.1421675 type:complete len:457 (-) comp25047_c0_seq38:5594-6964(-)